MDCWKWGNGRVSWNSIGNRKELEPKNWLISLITHKKFRSDRTACCFSSSSSVLLHIILPTSKDNVKSQILFQFSVLASQEEEFSPIRFLRLVLGVSHYFLILYPVFLCFYLCVCRFAGVATISVHYLRFVGLFSVSIFIT